MQEQDTVTCTTGNRSYLRPGDQWRPRFSATARTASRRHLSTLLPLSVASDARPVESVDNLAAIAEKLPGRAFVS